MQLLIESPDSPPVLAGSITIDVDPFIVDDWMLEKVSASAAEHLSKLILEANVGKVIN